MDRHVVSDPLKFITSGNAVFTLENEATGKRFTYKVVRRACDDGLVRYFVNLLAGPDNVTNYNYMGMFLEGSKLGLMTTKGSRVTEKAISFQAFAWMHRILMDPERREFPEGVKIYHEGRCGRCGRRLTVPESIKSGLGPECAGKAVMV